MKAQSPLRIFFGHDFFKNNPVGLASYRRKVHRGCSSAARHLKNPIQPLFGNTLLDTSMIDAIRNASGDMAGIARHQFWPRIHGMIRIGHLGIFDLSVPGGSPSDINWNVLLELGVALGTGIPVRVIARDRSSVVQRLTNLAGVQIEEYRNDSELGPLLKELICVFGKAGLSL